MDYESQSRKDKPFDGLSDDEKKHLFIYLCYVAHPSLTPEEIEKRWGRVLDEDKVPTVFEALEIANTMKQKVAPQDSQTIMPTPKKETSAWKPVAWILVVLGVVAAIAFGVSDEMRKAEIRKQEEMRKQKEQLQKEAQLRQETTQLMNAASSLLASTRTSPKELLNMGLRLQSIREENLRHSAILQDTNLMVLLDEALLRCYKKARGQESPFLRSNPDSSAIEACYRISLLYLRSRYRHLVNKRDQVSPLSKDMGIAMSYLKEAVECNHYRALSLVCKLHLAELDEFKNKNREYLTSPQFQKHLAEYEDQVSTYRHQLADHPEATGKDVYLYATWMAELPSGSSGESVKRYLKKAARMGHADAKKELLQRGITVDE